MFVLRVSFLKSKYKMPPGILSFTVSYKQGKPGGFVLLFLQLTYTLT